ncbi:hypothetical protein Taro_048943 [Colocasia esculenta]|uniref:Uncharacterized protein n=1 Tax=Colocasia esculenta TaxID=4460 RepID=A0A843X9J9_COLES|nr:hypothetical protein [Colocasia esculenta]
MQASVQCWGSLPQCPDSLLVAVDRREKPSVAGFKLAKFSWRCCCYRCWGWRSALDSLLKSRTILDLVVAASALQALSRNHPTLGTTMCLSAMWTLFLHTRGTYRGYLCTAGCYWTLRCLVHYFLLVLPLECSCRPLLRSLLLFQILLHLTLLSTSSTKCLVQGAMIERH